MNNCPGRGPGPRRSWPRRGRVAAVITVMAAALLVAACSGGPSSTGLLPAIRAARLSPTQALWTV